MPDQSPRPSVSGSLRHMTHRALLLLDTHGLVVECTRGAERLTALGRAQLMGRHLTAVLPAYVGAADDALDQRYLDEARACGALRTDQSYRYGSDGQPFWLEVCVEPLEPENAEHGGFAVSMTDVTARHEAEARLHESLNMLHVAEETAGLGHWRLDLATQQIRWSKGVYRVHGFDESGAPSLDDALNAYIEEDRGYIEEKLEEAIATRRGFAFRATIVRPDGVRRVVDVKGHVENDDSGQPIALFGVIRDATAESLTTRELVAARDEAIAVAEDNMMLLATMSHEIRTPLSGIIGMLESLRHGDSNVSHAQVLHTVESASRTLLTVLNDVLDHARIESGELALEQIAFDLAEIAHGTADLFEASANAKGVSLVRDVNGPYEVIGDPTRVQQILSNFLSNAIKFTSQGEVCIELSEQPDGGFLLEVSDTGIGIDQPALARLFKPFTQADVATSRRFGGSGLGLAICRRLAQAMGGEVGARSALGEGSCFWLRVPLVRVDASETLNEPLKSQRLLPLIDGRPAHVLVIDDTQTNRLVAESLLSAIGATVVSASNGLEGLQQLCTRDFDAILLDNAMPLLDGYTVSRLARALPWPWCAIPIIGFSAYVDNESGNAYVDATLGKPLQRDVLSQVLGEQLLIWQERIHERHAAQLPASLMETVTAHYRLLAESAEACDLDHTLQRARTIEGIADAANAARLGEAASFVSGCLETLDVERGTAMLASIECLIRRFTRAIESVQPSVYDERQGRT